MIVTCPSCSTRYKLDPTQFGPEGRRVRCTKCAHVWTQMPADDLPRPVRPDPAPGIGDEPDDGPRLFSPDSVRTAHARARAETPRPAREGRGTRRGGRAGWLVLALVVASLAAAGVLAREAVVRAWPPAERLYALIGVESPKPGAGLSIKVIEHRRDVEGKIAVLIVKGEVTNTSEGVRDVPRLKASLRSQRGAELTSWTFATAQARLLPGETAPFVTRIENPSTEASALNIDFTTNGL